MAEQLALATIGTDDEVVGDLDLRDEESLLAVDRAEYDVEGVRALLAAINLQPAGGVGGGAHQDAEIMDLAIFRATGSHRLARIFGPAN